jgi:hypothetical protein
LSEFICFRGFPGLVEKAKKALFKETLSLTQKRNNNQNDRDEPKELQNEIIFGVLTSSLTNGHTMSGTPYHSFS